MRVWPYFLCAFLSIVFVSLSACKSSTANHMVMGLPGAGSDGNFYANGFPTDLRRNSEGAIDIADFPRQQHWLTQHYVARIQTRIRGYNTVMPVYLPFTNAVTVSALPEQYADYAKADSPIQLIDVDSASPEFGRRFPLQVTMTRFPDTYRPSHLLQVIPTLGINLRPDTTYAVLVSDQTPIAETDHWEQHPQLSAVLSPAISRFDLSEDVWAVYAPLRHYLAQHNIDPDTIMGATVWTTGNPVAQFHRAAEKVAQQAEQLTTLPVSTLTQSDDYPEYCVIRGFVDLPGYQKGVPPYLLRGGEIDWTPAGAPVVRYIRNAEFVLTIPKFTPMPAQGFPLLSYVHGAGGRASQVYDRGEFDHLDFTQYPYYIGKAGEGPAQVAAERGWASSGLAGHVAYDHIPQWGSLNGPVVYNLYNPLALLGIYQTQAWERIFFRRIVDRIKIDRNLCPEADPGPENDYFHFDRNMQVNLGQSQGNWVSSLMVSADPRPYQGVIFSGAAGTWIRLFNNNAGFKLSMNTAVINRIPFMNLDDAHPFLMLMEWMLGAVDTVTNLETLMRHPAKTPPHVIGFSGYNDYMLSETVQRPFFLTLGSDLAGDDIGFSARRTFMPHLSVGGSRQLAYPVTGNMNIPEHGQRTNVVTRYRGDNPALLYNGHEVLFQSDAIKHQYGCFLLHLSQGIAPIVNTGNEQGYPCLSFLHAYRSVQ